MDQNFIIQHLAEAVNALLNWNSKMNSSLKEEVVYLATLTSAQVIEHCKNSTSDRRGSLSALERKSLDKTKRAMKSSSKKNLTEESEMIFEEDSDDIKFTYTDETYQFPKVKSATIEKLIERLTHEVYPGE